jgi:hypothetical protein
MDGWLDGWLRLVRMDPKFTFLKLEALIQKKKDILEAWFIA